MPRRSPTEAFAAHAQALFARQAADRVNLLRAMGWTVREIADTIDALPREVYQMARGETPGTPVQRAVLASAVTQTQREAGHYDLLP